MPDFRIEGSLSWVQIFKASRRDYTKAAVVSHLWTHIVDMSSTGVKDALTIPRSAEQLCQFADDNNIKPCGQAYAIMSHDLFPHDLDEKTLFTIWEELFPLPLKDKKELEGHLQFFKSQKLNITTTEWMQLLPEERLGIFDDLIGKIKTIFPDQDLSVFDARIMAAQLDELVDENPLDDPDSIDSIRTFVYGIVLSVATTAQVNMRREEYESARTLSEMSDKLDMLETWGHENLDMSITRGNKKTVH